MDIACLYVHLVHDSDSLINSFQKVEPYDQQKTNIEQQK